jgi:hypothetical protein
MARIPQVVQWWLTMGGKNNYTRRCRARDQANEKNFRLVILASDKNENNNKKAANIEHLDKDIGFTNPGPDFKSQRDSAKL